MYHYGGNNPVKYTDPDGRKTFYALITIGNNQLSGKCTVVKLLLQQICNAINQNTEHSANYIDNAMEADFKKAFNDPEASFIVILGHGATALFEGIETYDGEYFEPNDIDSDKIGQEIETVVFYSCYQKENLETWSKKIPSANTIITFEGEVSDETIMNHATEELERLVYKVFGGIYDNK